MRSTRSKRTSSKKTEESQIMSESSKKTEECPVKKSTKVSLSLKSIQNIIKKKEERSVTEESTSRGPIKIKIPLHDCGNHTSNKKKGQIQEIKQKPEKTNKQKDKKSQNDKDTNKRNRQKPKKNKSEEKPKTSQEKVPKNPKPEKVDEDVEITFPKESSHIPMKEPHYSVTMFDLLRGFNRDLKMIKINLVIQGEKLNKEIGNTLNEKIEKLDVISDKISMKLGFTDKDEDILNKIMMKQLQPVVKLLDNINQKLEGFDCKTQEPSIATSNSKEGTTSSDDVIRQAELFSQQNKAELLKIAENASPKPGTKRKAPDTEENLQIIPAKLRGRRSTFHNAAPTPYTSPLTAQPTVVTPLPVAVPAHQGHVTRQTVAATQQPPVAARHPIPLQPLQLDALFQVQSNQNKAQPIITRRRSLAAPSYYATRDAIYLKEMLKMRSAVDPRLQNKNIQLNELNESSQLFDNMRSIPNLFSQHATTQNVGINLTRDDTNAIHPTVQNDVVSPQSYAINTRPRENSSVNQESPGLYSTRPTVRPAQTVSGYPVQARGSNLFSQHATIQNAGINQRNHITYSRPREHNSINQQSPGYYSNGSTAQPTQINPDKQIKETLTARPTTQNTCSNEIEERPRFYTRVGRATQHNPSNQESYGANNIARQASPQNQHNHGTHLNPSSYLQNEIRSHVPTYTNFNTRQIQGAHPDQQNPQNYGYFSRLAEADNRIKNQMYWARSAGAAHGSGRPENN